MSAANKRRGASWELDLLKFLRARGYDAERLRLAGLRDEGDLVLKVGGLPYVIEAKNEKSINLSSYVQEAELEAHNYAKARLIKTPNFVSIVKRRSHGVDKAYVVMPLDQWLDQISTPF